MKTKKYRIFLPFVGLLLAVTVGLSNKARADWENGQDADLVLGQPDFMTAVPGTTAATMNQPTDVAIDPTTGNVFVCEVANHRVLRFDSLAALMDGDPAVGVLGQTDLMSATVSIPTKATFFNPRGIAIDANGTLWVADSNNRRVLKFTNASVKADANGADADAVLGQALFTTRTNGTSATTMHNPQGVAVDSSGTLYVADTMNHRVLRFASAAGLGDGAPANGVLGQGSFITADFFPISASSMRFPDSVETGSGGVLWVADGNNRVLRFDNAAVQADADGAPADGLLGQAEFHTNAVGTDEDSFDSSRGVALTPGGDLWVIDGDNHRALLFKSAAGKVPGAAADKVLGQGDFVTKASGLAPDRFNSPYGVFAVTNSVILLADQFNHRVIRFTAAPNPPNPAIAVLKMKIKRVKKAIKRAQKKNQRAKVNRLKRQLKRLQRQLRAL